MRGMASKWIQVSVVVLPSMLLTCVAARASGHVSGDALVRKPLIVVARCPTASAERHDLVENKAVVQAEGHTELIVERVIKGDIRPGSYKLLFGWGVEWPDEEALPSDRTLSHRLGQVADITQPNLWFLSRKRSWDKADPTVYLSLDTYQCVQPVVLETYFAALQDRNRQAKVRELLHSNDDVISSRASVFLTRGTTGSSQTPRCMNADPQAFGRMLGWYGMALLAKQFGVQAVRKLLNDKAPGLRLQAASYLRACGQSRVR